MCQTAIYSLSYFSNSQYMQQDVLSFCKLLELFWFEVKVLEEQPSKLCACSAERIAWVHNTCSCCSLSHSWLFFHSAVNAVHCLQAGLPCCSGALGKKAGFLCFVLSTEGEMPRLTPADPSKQGGEVAKSLEAVPGSSPEPERSTALSSVPWQLSTWNVTALENCTSASPQFQECSRKWAESYWFWWMLEKPVFPLRLHVLFHDAGVA